EDLVATVIARDLGDHLAVIGGGAEGRGIETDLPEQTALDGSREFVGRDLGPAGNAELVHHQQRLALGGPQRLYGVGQVLGVSETGEVRLRHDDDLVDRRERVTHPGRPGMGNVEHDYRHAALAQLDQLLEITLFEIEGGVEHDRCGEQVDVVCRLADQAVEEDLIHLLAGVDRIGDAVRRILVEVEPDRAEWEIEVENEHILPQVLGNGPGHVVGDGRTAGAALVGDDAYGASV